MMTAKSSSIDEAEVAKFSAMAEEWWDLDGKFKPLHQFNPVRIAYIRNTLCEFFERDPMANKPLAGLNIVDVGCGGGLLSVPMHRLGANVTGVDASEKNIKIAQTYAQEQDLDINFICQSVESLAAEGKTFDAVLNMEVIEHVADVESFMTASAELVGPRGAMFVATLNRTAKSYAFAIVGAEYLLRWLPAGTHDWKKFLKPHEIDHHLRAGGLTVTEVIGVGYNPISGQWKLSKDTSVNYMMVAKK
jgi:2-polyprenyl-6-hydroxyphenyl methylase/3-demethylubiquinone-9 3-methyltransferase